MENSQLNLKIVDIRSIAPIAPEKVPESKMNESCDSPLMLMIKDVINVRQNNLATMTLTNSHLLNILNLEYSMNTNNSSEFEIDVYVNVLKKYLKLWPNWDLLDEEICKKNCNKEINLNNAYKNLKGYLSQIFKETKEAIKYLQTNVAASMNYEDEDCPEVVLEINCTRHQLNNIIYRKPTPSGNIFNIIEAFPKVKEYFNAVEVINWPMVKTSICLPGIEMSRTNSMGSSIDRSLINIKRLENSIIKDMRHPINSNHIYFKQSNLMEQSNLSKDFVLNLLNKICAGEERITNKIDRQLFSWVMAEFVKDFSQAPNIVKSGDYRIYLHNYKYIRRLSVEMNENTDNTKKDDDCDSNNYHLCLQELLTPQVEFRLDELTFYDENKELRCFVKDDFFHSELNFNKAWLKIKCMLCNITFKLPEQYYGLLDHFNKIHHSEPDWECTGCHNTFNMKILAKNRWSHNCLPNQ